MADSRIGISPYLFLRDPQLDIHESSKPKEVNKRYREEEPSILDKKEPSIGDMLPAPYQHVFSKMRKTIHNNTHFKISVDKVVHELFMAVVQGNEEKVLEMVRISPELLLEARKPALTEKWQVKDYSGRIYDGLTAFQLMLCVGDEVMAEKVKDIYLNYYRAKGQEAEAQSALEKQFNEIFPEGYEAHLKAQQQTADEFEHAYLMPLVAAFDQANIEDLNAALAKQDNGSELCRKLKAFREAFTTLSFKERIYNPEHLLKAFETYDKKFSEWVRKFEGSHWWHLDLFWRQVIGWEERYMTTNYAQSACTGWGDLVEGKKLLERTLKLHNYLTNTAIHFFPLDATSDSGVGFDFGVYSYYSRAMAGGGGHAHASAVLAARRYLQNYCRAKTAILGTLCQANQAIARRPGV